MDSRTCSQPDPSADTNAVKLRETLLSNAYPYAQLQLKIENKKVESLHRPSRQVRRRIQRQIKAAVAAIRRFGPVLVALCTADGEIIDGEAYAEAYRELGYDDVPVILIEHLTEIEVRALRIAMGRIGQMGEFDDEILKLDLEEIIQSDPALLDATGFEFPEIDFLLNSLQFNGDDDQGEEAPIATAPAVSRLQDLWHFTGGHRLLCANARLCASYEHLLGDQLPALLLTDPPYGMLKIAGGASRTHKEFVEGSGLTEEKSYQFFHDFLAAAVAFVKDGALIYTFIDARSMFTLQRALRAVGLDQKEICVWDKQNPGMGSPYRHQAEFVIISKRGSAPHTDNCQLGRYGRNRTTVWRAPGLAGFGAGRDEALRNHPTCKPVGLMAEAIMDVTDRGQIVLDPFIGSGTTLLAAHRTQRIGYGIELHPPFVDCAVRRMERLTGQPARLGETGLTFAEVATLRAKDEMAASAPVSRMRVRAR